MKANELAKTAATLGRNDKCHCNSGKKYKHCHWDADQEKLHALKLKEEAAEKAEADATAAADEKKEGGEKAALPHMNKQNDHPGHMPHAHVASQVRLPRKAGNS